MNFKLLQDTLYSNDEEKKIYSLESNDIEESTDQIISGWSQSYQSQWISALTADLNRVAAYDPRPVGDNVKPKTIHSAFYNAKQSSWSKVSEEHIAANVPEPPSSLSALEVASLDPGQAGFDYRPHLFHSE